MPKWTCHHCGQEFTRLTGRDGLVYHRERCDGTGEFLPPQPPQPPQEAKPKPKEPKPKQRKMGRPKEQSKDPVTSDDKEWIKKNWT